jgi:hypothetical protein
MRVLLTAKAPLTGDFRSKPLANQGAGTLPCASGARTEAWTGRSKPQSDSSLRDGASRGTGRRKMRAATPTQNDCGLLVAGVFGSTRLHALLGGLNDCRMLVVGVFGSTMLRLPVKPWAQILPSWIERFNECDFLRPKPALDLLFPSDGAGGAPVRLKPKKFCHIVGSCKPRGSLCLVFGHAAHEVVCHSGVQDAGFAGKDVDVKCPLHEFLRHAITGSFERRGEWGGRRVRGGKESGAQALDEGGDFPGALRRLGTGLQGLKPQRFFEGCVGAEAPTP